MKKIKLFLAAYINYPNAQNVNCEHIARYIDKNKFEIHAMYTDKMPIDKAKYEAMGIHLHRLIHHRFIWYWSKLWSMWRTNADVYYIPKTEIMDEKFMNHFSGRGKKFVSSIEGVVGEQIAADDERQRGYFEKCDGVFSISRCIQESTEKCWDMKTPVIYLGVDEPAIEIKEKHRIQNVIWIGSVIERKRPDYLLECAKRFPELNFTMVGDGDQSKRIEERIQNEGLINVSMTGRIQNEKVYELLSEADLLLMTSDKEGLPKVIGEAMTMGVPAVYMNECYDVDYIENGCNGYGVATLNEMIQIVHELLYNPEKYQQLSKKARESIQPYLWSNLIHQYEEYFDNLMQNGI